MKEYWHSVRLEADKCKGCTNCIKLCPTQAIRVQNGKAKILKERCIDCGECIRVCPYHAKNAVTDSFDMLEEYKYKIALVAPAFYGQFSKAEDIDIILTALMHIGFDDVYEVARGAEIISRETARMLKEGTLPKPCISSACPAVVRIMAVRFPNLLSHIIPLRSPMEVSAKNAREEAAVKTGIAREDIGIFFISPCPAKATSVKATMTVEKSEVDGVISIKDTYLRLAQMIPKLSDISNLSSTSSTGVLWATRGGEAKAAGAQSHIAVDGIHNVIKVLEDIDDNKLPNVDYIEALACTGGCVGGALNVENNFVALSRLERLSQGLPKHTNPSNNGATSWDKAPKYRPVMKLDSDVGVAMKKAKRLEEIYADLPRLDCGSCGAPSCRALAEDIVRGFASETDCIFKLRERVRALTKEMIDLETQMPPSFNAKDSSDSMS